MLKELYSIREIYTNSKKKKKNPQQKGRAKQTKRGRKGGPQKGGHNPTPKSGTPSKELTSKRCIETIKAVLRTLSLAILSASWLADLLMRWKDTFNSHERWTTFSMISARFQGGLEDCFVHLIMQYESPSISSHWGLSCDASRIPVLRANNSALLLEQKPAGELELLLEDFLQDKKSP